MRKTGSIRKMSFCTVKENQNAQNQKEEEDPAKMNFVYTKSD